MKNKAIFVLVLFTLLFPVSRALAFSGTEVHISNIGDAVISGTKVMQIAGNTFFTRMYWGDSYVRLTIKTNANTKFYRATGELTTLSEITEGNLLDISGPINSGNDILTITATSVKNQSVQKKQNTFSGKVSGVDLSAGTFTLNTQNYGSVTVKTGTTTQFFKGSRVLDLAHVVVGDTITKTSGDYDIPSKTLQAVVVVTYISPEYYKAKNFQGTLQAVTGVTTPTTVKVMIDGKVYTVNLAQTTLVLNKVRSAALLSRFVVGDTVRIYGRIEEVDEPIIDAEILRNISL